MIDKGTFLRLVQGDKRPRMIDNYQKKEPSFAVKYFDKLALLLIVLLVASYFLALKAFPVLRCNDNYTYSTRTDGKACVNLHGLFWIGIIFLFKLSRPDPKKGRKSSVDLNVDAFGILGIKCCVNMPEPRADILKDIGFLPKYDVFWKDDILYLPNGKVPFYISEIMLKSNGRVLFQGIVPFYQMKNDFKAPLLLLNKKDYSNITLKTDLPYSPFVRWRKAEEKEIKTEGRFDVYDGEILKEPANVKIKGDPTNAIEPDIFLTPSFLQGLKTLEDAFRVTANVLFCRNMIILSLNVRTNLFEISSSDVQLSLYKDKSKEDDTSRAYAERRLKLDRLDESDLSRLYDEIANLVRFSEVLDAEVFHQSFLD